MAEAEVNGIRLWYEERGDGQPILCIHGGGSSALVWADAIERLARVGHVIAYDRRGCGRSERPEPYERTTVDEQADDASALLAHLAVEPAVVIGRSFGGWVATELARRAPERVRALALLEPDAPGLSPVADEWVARISKRLRAIAEHDGMDAVAEALVGEVAGEGAWPSFPDEVRAVLTENAPALLAEMRAFERPAADAAALAGIRQPVLLVAGADSGPELSGPTTALARVLPNARSVVLEGGHLIDPAAPEVIGFVEEVLA